MQPGGPGISLADIPRDWNKRLAIFCAKPQGSEHQRGIVDMKRGYASLIVACWAPAFPLLKSRLYSPRTGRRHRRRPADHRGDLRLAGPELGADPEPVGGGRGAASRSRS